MGLKNLFNRKTKKTENPDTTEPIPTELPTNRFEKQLEQVFNKFDVNGDGKISSSELGSIMESLGHPLTGTELENLGFIDLKEFIELNTKGFASSELLETLKEAFNVFDVDKNGLITAEELKEVMGSLGEEYSIGECRKMIAGVDQDGDGMISFEEFKVMMMVNESK